MIGEITPQIAAIYLGQKCDCVWMVSDPAFAIKVGDVTNNTITAKTIRWLKKRECLITPHLRRLESLTEAEARELYSVYGTASNQESPSDWTKTAEFQIKNKGCLRYWWNGSMIPTRRRQKRLIGFPAVWLKLLSLGFDLFGLIDAGLAKEAVV